MIGELSAVATALIWSLSSIMIKSASERIGVIPLNALRAASGSVFVLATLFALGRVGELSQVPLDAAFYLIGAVVIGMGLGDTLYFRSITLVGVSRALPLSNVYPLFTLPVAVFYFGEGFTWLNLAGTGLVVIGVSLVSRTAGASSQPVGISLERFRNEGLLLAVAAALCWAFSTSVQKLALLQIDFVVANAIRTPIVALILLPLAARAGGGLTLRTYGWRALSLALATGVMSLGIGGLLFLLAVQEAGAAKAATLSAIAPIFAAPLSVFVLKEKMTRKLAIGTALTVVGTWLVIA